MEDSRIIELYWQRSEQAIAESAASYGSYCRTIAYNILNSREEAEECENDSYLRAWNSIPPERPKSLKTYLGRICRNLSLDRFRAAGAAKRGGGTAAELYDELSECIEGGICPEQALEAKELTAMLNGFLEDLGSQPRKLFMRRYWYGDKISDIACMYGLSEENVRVTLYRLRQKLKEVLSKEGIEI